MKTKYLLSAIVLISLLFVSGIASARPLNAPVGTVFTYQGKLTDGGAPADGTYDFEFKLYDALSGGSQVGSTVPLGDVAVADGLFTVQLDFGNVFDGTALFLEIGVRPGASIGAYTPLTPRQALTATPFAIYAAKAPWSGLTGVPAGLNDGVDDNTTYTAGDGLELVGTQFKGKGTSYQNVVIVAKSGGDFTTITAALASITDASASNPYLIYVAPGTYTEQVTMKQYVDIEGAGELTTKITYTGSASATGTVVGANDAELRFLTVENTGDGAFYAIAIYNNGASPRLTHITASALGGGYTYGVYNSGSSPIMTNITASASGVNSNYGVYNEYSSPTMTNVTASASGISYNYGVANYFSSPVMMNVTANASWGTEDNYGVRNALSSPMMTSVTASASGGTNSYGMRNYDSSPTINNSVISADSGIGNFGIYNSFTGDGSCTVWVNNSQVSGATTTIYNDPLCTTRVGASQLDGGAVTGGGTVICAGVYDAAYTFYASTCP